MGTKSNYQGGNHLRLNYAVFGRAADALRCAEVARVARRSGIGSSCPTCSRVPQHGRGKTATSGPRVKGGTRYATRGVGGSWVGFSEGVCYRGAKGRVTDAPQ